MASAKSQIKDALNELEGLYQSREKIAAKRKKDFAPHQATFDEATAPIAAKYDEQAAPVNTRIAALEKEIQAQMLAKFDETGNPKYGKVESDKLLAEASFTQQRELGPEEFIKAAKGKAGAWDCVSILIGKAEKLLGKLELDKLAKTKRTWRVGIRAK